MTVAVEMVPREVQQKIITFLQAGKTGNITLDVKEGRVLAWKITEAGRVDKYGIDKNL